VKKNDRLYMKRCFELAKKGSGMTSPNPMVGAVVVKGGEVIAEGYHKMPGQPHAEINVLNQAGRRANGATLYLNLEPCTHYGRTPPCVDRIIEAGIRRVVCASVDPNPLVNGKGVERLRQAGIEVIVGILEEEARRLNEVYLTYITKGLPFAILKLALSLDGRITLSDGGWITGQEARKTGHRLRSQVDAILVGRGTVIKDDPQLTTRLVRGKDPIRIIVDSKATLPSGSRVITKNKGRIILAATKLASSRRLERLKAQGVEVLIVKEKDGLVDLRALLKKLAKREITSLLVEGGAKIATSFLKERLINKVTFFISPKIIGQGGLTATTDRLPLIELSQVVYKKIGKEILVTGYM